MKISMFHLMPHRELPADFEKKYHSVWVDPPWWELADAKRVGQYYNWTLDELTYAAKAGLDGVCVNEHHQNAYGFMPGPNLMGSALARATCAYWKCGDGAPVVDMQRRLIRSRWMAVLISSHHAVKHNGCETREPRGRASCGVAERRGPPA